MNNVMSRMGAVREDRTDKYVGKEESPLEFIPPQFWLSVPALLRAEPRGLNAVVIFIVFTRNSGLAAAKSLYATTALGHELIDAALAALLAFTPGKHREFTWEIINTERYWRAILRGVD